MRNAFWETQRLQQEVSAGGFFTRGNRGGADLSVIHLRREHSSFEGKPLVNT